MRLRSFAGLFCSSFTIAVMVLAACGSEDQKKKNNDSKYDAGGDGGTGASGGEGPLPRAGNGGSLGEGGDGTGQGGTAGTAPTAGSSSATGGAGGATGEGGAGGDGTAVPFNGLYVGPDGSDTADGTLDAPFKTLAHAASLAVAGDTIVFLPGDYTLTPPAVTIPAGVNLMAQSSGESFLSGTGALLTLQGDTRITGLDIENFSTPITFAGAAAASGTVTIEDTRFESCSQSCLTLPGASKAVVIGDGNAVLANGGGAFAILSETASLSVTEGVLQNFQAGGIIRADDESTVFLTDITVDGGTGIVLTLRGDSKGVVDGATITTLSASLLQQFESSELTVTGSDLSMRGGTPFNCITTAVTSKLTVEDSKLHDCGTGIKSGPPLELTVTDTEFYNLDFGAEMNPGGGAVAESTILIEGCNLHDISYSALRLGGSTTKLNVKMRDTLVDVSTQANWGGVILSGTNASQVDLGTLAEPGGNTFLQRNTTAQHTALQVALTAVTVYAVGNTWTPLEQSADVDGHYAVVTGKFLDITAAVNNGRNYTKPQPTTTLRLAQIP
ncbi:MAG TPA: right-handed parallel beta-helix repeat-containing protein [Polyangiaceae bacterium]|nr:right-handed parallel beta-helix repeat-containing protein [Polyangiaceae bacterium]